MKTFRLFWPLVITNSDVVYCLDEVPLRLPEISYPPELICSHSELRACAFVSLVGTTTQPSVHFHNCLSRNAGMCTLHANVQNTGDTGSASTDPAILGTQSGWGPGEENSHQQEPKE